MTIDDKGQHTTTNDYWDQVEPAPDFNKGLTGAKLISPGHLKAEKPG